MRSVDLVSTSCLGLGPVAAVSTAMLVVIHLLQIPPFVLRVQQVHMAQGLLPVAALSVQLAPTPLDWVQFWHLPASTVLLAPTQLSLVQQ